MIRTQFYSSTSTSSDDDDLPSSSSWLAFGCTASCPDLAGEAAVGVDGGGGRSASLGVLGPDAEAAGDWALRLGGSDGDERDPELALRTSESW